VSYSLFKLWMSVLLLSFSAVGCATLQVKPKHEKPSPSIAEVTRLQSELAARDRKIFELEGLLKAKASEFRPIAPKVDNKPVQTYDLQNKNIHAPGVSVTDVQRALTRAGYETGPIDGHFGKKTRDALKRFQKAKGLKADGFVGKQTWSLLQV